MKKPKRILIIAPFGFNDRMTNFIEFVTARLLVHRGWEVIAIAKSDNGSSGVETVEGITVHRYASPTQGIRQLISIFRSFKPSIVHFHNLRNNRVGIAGSMLSRVFGIRLLCTEYGLLHDHYLTDERDDPLGNPIHPERVMRSLSQLVRAVAMQPHRFRYFLGSYFFHWPLVHADILVFVSEHNLPIAKSLRLPTALYLPQISDDLRWHETEEQLSPTDVVQEQRVSEKLAGNIGSYALFVGQMKLRKGWDVLLRALPSVPNQVIEKAVFVSSSTKQEHEEFTALAETLGISDRVIFLGQVPSNSLLHKIYAASTVVVVPSRYEGFGLVPLEAFEMQKPVVASRVEALTEYLVDGENSRLVPPKDPGALARAITEVASDTTFRQKLIQGGERTLELLRSKEYADRWVTFYDSQLEY
jgi:glycosyltransferase involved in cell wall biosynthesis